MSEHSTLQPVKGGLAPACQKRAVLDGLVAIRYK
jgi:hypothetical protein